MNSTARRPPGQRPRARSGAAMFEFLLMVPLLMFILALGGYLALGMRSKQDTLVRSRYDLWLNINQWWHNWTEEVTHWSNWDTGATGPIGSGANTGNRPRGVGEELEYLYQEAGSDAYNAVDNPMARTYFRTIWNNLPGRHVVRRSRTLETASAVEFLTSEIRGRHTMDSSTWPVAHMRLWLFAQQGPMQEINQVFHEGLEDVPDEFKRARAEILHNWFSEDWMPNWNNQYAVFPQ